MPSYYLRLEGVNLSQFIFDTNDLSTMRGGSLLLKNAPAMLESAGIGAFQPVSTGASSGWFRFEASNDSAAAALRDRVEVFFRGHAQLHHATVMVDALPADAFVRGRQLLALNRFRQMRSPSVAIPERVQTRRACDIDGVRPAAGVAHKGPERLQVSQSVLDRRSFGRGQKQSLYRELLGIDVRGVEDFEELATGAPEEFSQLDGKMAVIRMDGNEFRKIQDAVATNEQSQGEYDRQVQDKARDILRALIQAAQNDRRNWFSREGNLRLETLLLAGDEINFIVPAWRGWFALSFFFDQFRGWRIGARPMTYKAGLVFCQHHAPIQRILQLASDLQGLARSDTAAKWKGQSVVAYQILESFDHLGRRPEEFRRDRCPPGTSPGDLAFQGERMGEIARYIAQLRGFPRNKLHDIVRALYDGNREGAEALIRKARAELQPEVQAALDRLEHPDWLGPAGWPHLLELWDYALP